MSSVAGAGRAKGLVLAAMTFAVAMTFIDQTIVSIAVPQIQRELHLSATGVQWAVNAYLLTLAAFFAWGGRLADTVGHRRMVIIGVSVFAAASGLCGLTPTGGAAEAWIVAFRAVQGIGGAILFPAALASVVDTFSLRERGKALAAFFAIASGLTAVGPVLGGFLTQWTWRAIFWVNIPVAVIALLLVALSPPDEGRRPLPMDRRGLALVVAGVALSVFGFQQSSLWGWHNPGTWICIVAGAAVLVVFVRAELRTPSPLIQMKIFRNRAFLVDALVLGISMTVFVPTFFFASEYAQVALAKSAFEAGLYLMFFFAGFVAAAQIGGRLLDAKGAKVPVVLGCALASVGYGLWASQAASLSFSDQQWYVIVAGAGMGFMLSPASTDAVSRASRLSYGEATGITQTVRNYAASLGLAVLGTILVASMRSHTTTSLIHQGAPPHQAHRLAASIAELHSTGAKTAAIPHFIRLDFADAAGVVLAVMSGLMALAALVALVGLRSGVQEASEPDPPDPDQPTAPAAEAAT